jgi:hypothetical protein
MSDPHKQPLGDEQESIPRQEQKGSHNNMANSQEQPLVDEQENLAGQEQNGSGDNVSAPHKQTSDNVRENNAPQEQDRPTNKIGLRQRLSVPFALIAANKMVLLQWLYVLSAIITIVVPFNIHHPSACNNNERCFFFLHTTWYLFNWGTSAQPFFFAFKPMEIWELFALLQVALFSSIVIWEADDRKINIRISVLTMIGIIGICLIGIGLLGKHQYFWYQVAMILIVSLLLIVDVSFHVATHDKRYLFLWLFVDIPILAALIVLNVYVSFPIGQEYFHFYSGAIAFQLMIGNLLIFITGLYVATDSCGGFSHALKKSFIPQSGNKPGATN